MPWILKGMSKSRLLFQYFKFRKFGAFLKLLLGIHKMPKI